MPSISPIDNVLKEQMRKAEERLQAAAKHLQVVTDHNEIPPGSQGQIQNAVAQRIAADKEYKAAEIAVKAAIEAASKYNRRQRGG